MFPLKRFIGFFIFSPSAYHNRSSWNIRDERAFFKVANWRVHKVYWTQLWIFVSSESRYETSFNGCQLSRLICPVVYTIPFYSLVVYKRHLLRGPICVIVGFTWTPSIRAKQVIVPFIKDSLILFFCLNVTAYSSAQLQSLFDISRLLGY